MANQNAGKAGAASAKLVGHHFTSLKALLGALNVNHGAADSTQSKCLTKYLRELRTECCVVERDYTEADYLADYVGYYARCHDAPSRVTTRLHFFSLPFEVVQANWNQVIHRSAGAAEAQKQLIESYVGFIVLRPLPVTVIGRTCLKTYPGKDDAKSRRRVYPITRKYKVHLYGLDLSVDSVAFQQQDKEIAACATAAIWFTMHALPSKFTVSEIPSPFAITTDGWESLIMPTQGETMRKFPAVGLDIKQIDGCLRTYGLECMVSGTDPTFTSNQIHEHVAAYVQGGYPMIVVSEQFTSEKENSGYKRLGLHAITVLGHSYKPEFVAGPWFERIERIYAHDDGVGPFASYSTTSVSKKEFDRLTGPELDSESMEAIKARLEADAKSHEGRGSAESPQIRFLKNESGINHTGKVYSLLVPRYFIVPTHPKVRLPYETVHLLAKSLQTAYTRLAPQQMPPNTPLPPLSWDVRLEEVSSFKARVPDMTWLSTDQRVETLLRKTSRFLWTLLFTREGDDKSDVPLLMLVLDATALKQSGGVSFLLWNDADSCALTLTTSASWWITAYIKALSEENDQLTRVEPDVEVCFPELARLLPIS